MLKVPALASRILYNSSLYRSASPLSVSWNSPSSCACNSLPGLKRIVLPEGIATSSPVRGLRPTPRLRGLTTKTPKPRNSIRSPRVKASFIEWKRASTACSAFILGTPVFSATRLTMSSLITAYQPPFEPLLGVFEPNLREDDREAQQTLSTIADTDELKCIASDYRTERGSAGCLSPL